MEIVAAICTQCGGKIQVDTSKEKMFCTHCGTEFIVQETLGLNNLIRKTIEVARYKVKEEKDYSGALETLERIKDIAWNTPEFMWVHLDALTRHFTYFGTYNGIKAAFKMINRISESAGLSEEQYEFIYAYMHICMNEAEQNSRFFTYADNNITMMRTAIMKYSMDVVGDENEKTRLESYLRQLEKSSEITTKNANEFYDVYIRLKKEIEKYDSGDRSLSIKWEHDFWLENRGSCWDEFA